MIEINNAPNLNNMPPVDAEYLRGVMARRNAAIGVSASGVAPVPAEHLNANDVLLNDVPYLVSELARLTTTT